MRRLLPISLALVALTVACADRDPTGAVPAFKVAQDEADGGRITVMSQNLYVGADVDAVIGALATPSPDDDVPALLFAIETLGKTDYPARADAIADEIARERPHVVGLQEVSVIDIDLTALGMPIIVNLDFLEILRAKLAERGLHYDVAAQVENIVAEPLPGISLVDHDAMLVDADRVTVTSAGGRNFTFNVGVVAPGIELKRGWVFAHATIAGDAYTFVSTHAEADLGGATLGGLRALQLAELVGSVASAERVVMLGDFNDVPGSPMHQVVTGAGFTDVWAASRPGVIGFTCCHRPDLSDEIAPFSQRIDYIFTRGLADRGKIDRFGEVPGDRLAGPAYPIWPSDHVGMIATLRQ